MKDPFNVNKIRDITKPINDRTRKIIRNLVTNKDAFQEDDTKIDDVIDTLTNYIHGSIKLNNPLNMAENLHKGNYVNIVNNSQLWIMKQFYETINYNAGLIDVGNRFLSIKNYHGAFETFHSAKYSQGLIDMTKDIITEINSKKYDNIAYAKKALVDIVKLEGNSNVKQYIDTIADAYISEYKELLLKTHVKNDDYLYEALELYSLNKNHLKMTKTVLKIAYHKLNHENKNTSKYPPVENYFNM